MAIRESKSTWFNKIDKARVVNRRGQNRSPESPSLAIPFLPFSERVLTNYSQQIINATETANIFFKH